MPEPDFDSIARAFLDRVDTAFTAGRTDQIVRATVEQLRAVWNARGAADIAKLEAEWRDGITEAPVLRAIRSVDR